MGYLPPRKCPTCQRSFWTKNPDQYRCDDCSPIEVRAARVQAQAQKKWKEKHGE